MNGNCNKIHKGCYMYMYIIISYVICTGFKNWEQQLRQLLQFSSWCVDVVNLKSITCSRIVIINIFTNSNRQDLEILNLCISNSTKPINNRWNLITKDINTNFCDIWESDWYTRNQLSGAIFWSSLVYMQCLKLVRKLAELTATCSSSCQPCQRFTCPEKTVVNF